MSSLSRVFKFLVNLQHYDIPYRESLPIYDDYYTLVGAFTLSDNGLAAAFVANSGYPIALDITSGLDFYFTPEFGSDTRVSHALVSQRQLSEHSILIRLAEET